MSLQDKLRQLFLLEQQVRGLRSRFQGAEKSLDLQNTRHARIEQQKAEVADQLKHARTKAAALEHQSQDVEERVTKLREQMNSVRTNKEYFALLIEVNTLKLEKGKFEEQALEAMTRCDALEAQHAELEAKALEQSKLVSGAAAQAKQAKDEVSGRLDELTIQRDAAAAEVPKDALVAFNKLASIHDGEAMAVVVEESRRHREYSCGGCFMSLPMERVNTLMTKDTVVVCPSCGRILYLDENLKPTAK